MHRVRGVRGHVSHGRDPSAPALPAPVAVVAPPATPFARWVADFSASARAAGITEATLHQAFDKVQLVPQVIASDKAQPEFTRTVWAYLDSAVSPQRVSRGQTRLRNLPQEVGTVPARYGVPLEIVVAIWGMESNYGSFTGDIPTIDEAWIARLPPADGDEQSMLEMTAAERRPGSRLSWQINVDAALEGLVVHLPATQY